jgi:flavorubredoxin
LLKEKYIKKLTKKKEIKIGNIKIKKIKNKKGDHFHNSLLKFLKKYNNFIKKKKKKKKKLKFMK